MPDRSWRHAGGVIALDRCRVMAIVNVTPDSFYDGGRWIAQSRLRPNASVVLGQCRRWIEQGADLLDIGGESTRPGAEPVDEQVELARVLPIIEGLRADPSFAAIPISVDTRRAAVAEVALAAGATIVNDISGLADPQMAKVVAAAGAGLVISHLRGEPATMQDRIAFDDPLAEVGEELAAALARAEAAGVEREQILVDPGIGFGKTAEQSAALVGASELLARRTGRPVLIGASRKRFLGTLSGGKPVEERMLASVVAAVVAAVHGAAVVRVHDVAETVEALRVHAGIEAQLQALSRTSS
ncbi:MAG: dihydropteroate synthase [Enhygromyxa sp.]